jgi:hypothetical protein
MRTRNRLGKKTLVLSRRDHRLDEGRQGGVKRIKTICEQEYVETMKYTPDSKGTRSRGEIK